MLIGDGNSSSKGWKTNFCRKWKNKSKHIFNNAKTETIAENFEHLIKDTAPDASIVVNCGTDDFHQNRRRCTPREDLLARYKKIISIFKENKANRTLSIAGILPRLHPEKGLKIGTTNKEIEKMCTEEQVGFIKTWNAFHNKEKYYSSDGIHLNQQGKKELGNLLTGHAVESFFYNHSPNKDPPTSMHQ